MEGNTYKEELKKKHKINKPLFIKLAIFAFTVFLNILAWNVRTFPDWYIANIMPLWINTYSRFISIFPVSVGEILIIAAIILLAAGVVIFLLGFLRTGRFKLLRRKYWGAMSWIIVCVFLVQTLNCFILYHASTFESQYMSGKDSTYGFNELKELREDIVYKLNSLSVQFRRNSDGEIIYGKDLDTLYNECISSMLKVGEKYPALSGYYPQPKKIAFSKFMSQQYLSGIFFPFTLEANYNTEMYITNLPFTICHELAHLKGYIYEDEANFIAFLACTGSDDLFLQYCGYLNVLNYVADDFRENASEDEWNSRTLVTDEVASDNIFLTDDAWEEVNETSVFKTETVETISNQLLDNNLKINGIGDGIKSYRRVVRLILEYYS